MENLREYVDKHFPGLTLKPGLFYRWPTSLRFGLRPLPGECKVSDEPRLEWSEKNDGELMADHSFRSIVYSRALTLFQHIFRPNDHIWLVARGSKMERWEWRKYQGLRGVRRFFKYRQLPSHHYWTELSDASPAVDEDETQLGHWFCCRCLVRDLRYGDLLMAIANRDFPDLRPITFDDYVFVNEPRQVVFHMYDDRGLDLVFGNPSEFRTTYRQFGQWLLAYDLAKMDEVTRTISSEGNEV